MELRIIEHLFVDDGEISEVRLREKPFKARMVAQFAFGFSVEEAAEHYGVSKGAIYAAMSFYEDNREVIEQALEEDHQGLLELGMISGKEATAKIKARMKQGDTTNSS